MKSLVSGAQRLGITLTDGQVLQFEQHQKLLLDWNQRMNLTAVRDADQIQERHFLDSLTCSLATGDLNGLSLVDVGTGAGFPGLPLKIVYPDLQLTLVESVHKKTNFLAAVVEELELSDVQIVARRIEEVGQDPYHREKYDWAVARAVAGLNTLVEYLLPLARVGGHALAQKGVSAISETAAAEKAIAILGGSPSLLHPVQLPGREQPYYLLVIEKILATPDQYPRRVGVAAKRPLQ
jgi:16S rRNA (guanine527-N7)-methyltransferase